MKQLFWWPCRKEFEPLKVKLLCFHETMSFFAYTSNLCVTESIGFCQQHSRMHSLSFFFLKWPCLWISTKACSSKFRFILPSFSVFPSALRFLAWIHNRCEKKFHSAQHFQGAWIVLQDVRVNLSLILWNH